SWRRRTAGWRLSVEPLQHRRNERRSSFLLLQQIAARQKCQEIPQCFHHAQELAQILKSVDDRLAVVGTEGRREGGTLLFATIHTIFFVALKCLTDQVLLVKCQDREWNGETAVRIVFVPHIAVREFTFPGFGESLTTAGGLR